LALSVFFRQGLPLPLRFFSREEFHFCTLALFFFFITILLPLFYNPVTSFFQVPPLGGRASLFFLWGKGPEDSLFFDSAFSFVQKNVSALSGGPPVSPL